MVLRFPFFFFFFFPFFFLTFRLLSFQFWGAQIYIKCSRSSEILEKSLSQGVIDGYKMIQTLAGNKLTGTTPLNYIDLVNLGSESSFTVGGKMKLWGGRAFHPVCLVQSGHRYVKIPTPSPFRSARSGSDPSPLDISNLAVMNPRAVYVSFIFLSVHSYSSRKSGIP